jgi:predicted GIY-YIG superfamily endonuclease
MCKNKGEALKEEFSIKKLSRKDKIDLISSQNKL